MTDDERAICDALTESLTLLDVTDDGLAPGHQLELLYTIAGLCRDVKAITAIPADVEALLLHNLAAATEDLLTTAVIATEHDRAIATRWIKLRGELLSCRLGGLR